MFALLSSGGVVMIPIAVCALLATFIIFERLFYFYNLNKRDKLLHDTVFALLAKRDYPEAKRQCGETATPTALVVNKILESRTMNESGMKEIAEVEINTAVPQLEHLLPTLATISHVSTLLGLLGTVIGNIQAFSILGEGGVMGNPALFSRAIAGALITTAAGLFVSIPTVVFYNYFSSQISKRITAMESFVMAVIFRITRGI
jgi:biopolymer transport protein ExbB